MFIWWNRCKSIVEYLWRSSFFSSASFDSKNVGKNVFFFEYETSQFLKNKPCLSFLSKVSKLKFVKKSMKIVSKKFDLQKSWEKFKKMNFCLKGRNVLRKNFSSGILGLFFSDENRVTYVISSPWILNSRKVFLEK